jgi:hypothetical protein
LRPDQTYLTQFSAARRMAGGFLPLQPKCQRMKIEINFYAVKMRFFTAFSLKNMIFTENPVDISGALCYTLFVSLSPFI